MLTSLATESHHKSRLSAATSTTTALRVVRWRGRYISQMNDIEVANVYAQFHCRGTKQCRKVSATKPSFPVLPQVHRNLSSVRTTFNSNQSSSSFPVKLCEELVRFAFGFMESWRDHPFRAYRIGRRRSAVAKFPLQRSSLQLNPVLVLLCGDNREVIAPQDCDEF